ncbi:Phage hyaluronidase [Streptococcus oralis]|uniref:Phage hyaluronidase n=2 Tax=Streptococcus oralis TaxID=1303 RepID=A0A139NUF7_STROR|nr:Phage hyaluronidase [Streptococcus oralis]
MALTNQLFQVEVAKASAGGRNYIRNGQFKNGSKNWLEYQSVDFGLNFNYQHSQNPNNRNRPGLHFYHESQDVANFFGIRQSFAFDGARGEKVSVSLLVSKDGGDSNSGLRVALHYIKNKNTIGQEWQNIPSPQITSKYKRFTFTFTLSDDVENMNLMLYGEKGKTINLYVTDVQLERGSVATDYKEAPEDTDEAIRTVQSQLAGSWAVQNINSAGDLISGLNLGANGHNRLSGKLTHITGETLIDNASIKSAAIASIRADQITTGTLNAASVNIINLNANKLVGLDATFLRGKIENAIIDWLVGKTLISQNGSTTLNLQTGVFTLNNEDSSITFSRSSDNTGTRFSKNGIHFLKNGKNIASIGQSAFSSIYDNKHKSGFSITLPNDQGISFSGYDSSPFFEINPYENSLSIQSGFSLLIGLRTSQSVSLEHFFGTTNNVNFSGFRAKGTRRQALLFYADGRIEITTRG